MGLTSLDGVILEYCARVRHALYDLEISAAVFLPGARAIPWDGVQQRTRYRWLSGVGGGDDGKVGGR